MMRAGQCSEFRSERADGFRNVYSLWSVDELFRRPLIVLGMTPGERRRIVRKGLAAGGSASSLMTCEGLLRAAETVNALSCRMSRLLRRKYDREAGAMRRVSEELFLAQWDDAVHKGNCGALLWAAATRPLSSGGLLAVSRGIARLLCEAASHNPQACLAQRAEQQRLRDEIEALRLLAAELGAENAALRDALVSKAGRCAVRQGFLPALPHQAERRGEGRRMRPLLGTGSEACCDRDCNETCPSFDVCSKRVLIVGGVERMEALYRQVIEGGGGELDYHSGSLQGGTRQLEKSLRRADIILCPVNCNSHGACIKVKNLAKKHNKTCYMLPNGSMSTISRLLRGGEPPQTGMN